MNVKMVFQRIVLATAITILPITTFAQNNRFNQMSQSKNNSFELRIDNAMTDAQLKQDETDAKKFDFEVSFSKIMDYLNCKAFNEKDEIVQEHRASGNRYGIRYEELLSFILSAI